MSTRVRPSTTPGTVSGWSKICIGAPRHSALFFSQLRRRPAVVRLTWDEATFREYIKDPKAKVPGTKMAFAGLKDEQKVNDLVAYLKQFGPDGKKIQ
ncbi:MAG: hypothetical protein WCC41_21760, partial [Rhodomicrobium sp.]